MKVVAEAPDFGYRSALTIRPGRWRMRNGHTALVQRRLNLPFGNGKQFPVWIGKCVECEEARTWNVNGTYGAIGKHGYDLLGLADEAEGVIEISHGAA